MKGHRKVAFLLYKDIKIVANNNRQIKQSALKLIAFLYKRNRENKMAGVLGFEPRDAEIKTRCLTAWRYPNYYLTAS